MHMKNLFKFTLCAFAAIALTNCTEDLSESGNGNNTPDAGFTMTIHAGVAGNDTDETRTAVKIDTLADNTTAYRVIWKGNDQLSIAEFANYEISEDGLTVAYQKEGSTDKLAIFQTKFKSIMGEDKRYDYLSCYPHNNKNSFTINASEAKAYMTMPATQTYDPAGLVDGSAMLLTSAHLGNEGRPYQIDLRFKHAAAYVKMTFDGIELGKGEKITDIILTAGMEKEDGETTDEDAYLAGSCVYTYAADPEGDGSTATDPDGDQSKSVTLKVSNADFAAGDTPGEIRDNLFIVPTFTVYFATLPVELDAFTVTIVTDTQRRYVKKVDVSGGKGKPIPFVAGEVRAVKISGQDFETEKLTVYRKATSVANLKDKECVIVSTDNILGDLYTMLNSGTNNSVVAGKKIGDPGVGFAQAKFDFDGTSEDVLLHADASEYTWTISGTDTYTFVSTKEAGTGLYCANVDRTNEHPLALTNESEKLSTWTIEYKNSNFTIRESNNIGYMQTYSSSYNNWYAPYIQGMATISIYYKTDQSKDVNDKEEEVIKEKPLDNPKYYRKVSVLEANKNYVIAAQYDGKLYTFNNYNSGTCTPSLLLADDAGDGVKNAGFKRVTDKIYADMELYESNLGVYYTWNRKSGYSGDYFITTDDERLSEANNPGLRFQNNDLILYTTYHTFAVNTFGDGFSFYYSTNNVYLNLASTDKWTFSRNQQEIYFYEELDEIPQVAKETYTRVTTITAGKKYIIAHNNYSIKNYETASGNIPAVSLFDDFEVSGNTITGDGTDYYFIAVANGDTFKFQSPKVSASYGWSLYLAYMATNLRCSTTSTSFTIGRVVSGQQLTVETTVSSKSYYLHATDNYFGPFSTSWSSNECYFYFYEKQE